MRLQAGLRRPDGSGADISGGAAQALDRRQSERRALRLSAVTGSTSANETPVFVLDISEGGLLVEAKPGVLATDDYLEIILPEQGLVRARVAWRSERYFGCEFDTWIAAAAVSAAPLRGEPLAPASIPDVAPRDEMVGSRGLEPELNFSTALGRALALWAAIGTAVYLH